MSLCKDGVDLYTYDCALTLVWQFDAGQTGWFTAVCCPPCGPPGVDKENVQLSPSSALSSGGRTRHGSASQVQKQRSAGSFKRPSIKKIVWSAGEQGPHATHPPPPSYVIHFPGLLGLMLCSTFPPYVFLVLHCCCHGRTGDFEFHTEEESHLNSAAWD